MKIVVINRNYNGGANMVQFKGTNFNELFDCFFLSPSPSFIFIDCILNRLDQKGSMSQRACFEKNVGKKRIFLHYLTQLKYFLE